MEENSIIDGRFIQFLYDAIESYPFLHNSTISNIHSSLWAKDIAIFKLGIMEV